MTDLAEPLVRLIDQLRKLPGIGPKSAQRLAFHLLRRSEADCRQLAQAVLDIKERIRYCSSCHNLSEKELCSFCTSPSRNARVLCVVEEPFNILTIEKSGEFQGLYHVLHGALSPINGVGPEQLRISGLVERIRQLGVEEVIVATNPTIEGQATAILLAQKIKPLGVKVTRIAMGVAVGSDLEYVDEVTLARALHNRNEL